MKKNHTIPLAIAAVALLASSCTRECKCTTKTTASGYGIHQSDTQVTIIETKGRCSSLNNTITTSTTSVTAQSKTECVNI